MPFSEEITEEVEVLTSIYQADFEHRKSAWNLPSFIIRLKATALTDGASYVSLILAFTLPNQYPRLPPKFEVEAVKGLSDKCLEELKEKLDEEVLVRAGQVMCYELATIAKDHLEMYNKKPQSLFESMTSRHQRETNALRNLRETGGKHDVVTQNENMDIDDILVDELEENKVNEEVPLSPYLVLKQQKARLEAFKQSQQVTKQINKGPVGISSREMIPINIPTKLVTNQEAVVKQHSNLTVSIADIDNSINNKLQLQEQKASRYHDEFEEISLLGKG
jgi:hypothetical protein